MVIFVTIFITMTIAHMKIGWWMMIRLMMIRFWVIRFMMVWLWMVRFMMIGFRVIWIMMIRVYMMVNWVMKRCWSWTMWSKPVKVWSMNLPKKSKIWLG